MTRLSVTGPTLFRVVELLELGLVNQVEHVAELVAAGKVSSAREVLGRSVIVAEVFYQPLYPVLG